MRKVAATGIAVGAMVIPGGGGVALAAPADQGNCISTQDNGGAAGDRISSSAGRGFGPVVASAIGGGVLGARASDPSCRRSGAGG